jgi:hypothetical protein
MFKKIVGILILISLIQTSIIPSINGNIKEDYKNKIIPSENYDILFADDFNDNIKDYSKWTEIYTAGTWEEINQRCQFKLYEEGKRSRKEGIESTSFSVDLSSGNSVIATWDLFTDIGSTGWVSRPFLEITDGINWIRAGYYEYHHTLYYKDSTGNYIILKDNQNIGTWSNILEIELDRYRVNMNSYDSGWVNESIFSSNPDLNVQLVLQVGGLSPSKFSLVGFDNLIITGNAGLNNPPNPPSNPNPYSGATGVDVNAELSWSCSDPDGNPLSYDVYFGTNPTPSLLSSNQTGNTYKPATMSYSTLYYWKIVAKDNHGAVTNGSIWSFTTTDQPNNPPATPTRPSGPAYGYSGTIIEFSTIAADPDLDQIKYGWDWNGNDVVDEWTALMDPNSTCYRTHKWNMPGEYNIKVKVKDSNGAVSSWSDIWQVTIYLLNYDPNTPTMPNGPNEGEINIEYEYLSSTTDPDGDLIRYIWDWDGDGEEDEESSYLPSGYHDIRVHSWSFGGTYNIQVMVEDEHGAQSDWSPALTVEISGSENYAPFINIEFPEENNNITGLINIYGTASDPDGNETLTQVEVKIDDKPWQNATGTNYWNYSWNTDNETVGIHTIKARSYDGDLYSNYFIINVFVIHNLPDIIITNIFGGIGVTTDIKNKGTIFASDVNWSIDVEVGVGLILSGSHTENIIDKIDVNETITIQSNSLLGIGLITINVQAADAEKQATAFLLGPLVLRVTEL